MLTVLPAPKIGTTRERPMYPGRPPITTVFRGWRVVVPKYNYPGSGFSVPYDDMIYTYPQAAEAAATQLRTQRVHRFVAIEQVWTQA